MEDFKSFLRLCDENKCSIPYQEIQKDCRPIKEFDKLKCSRESQVEEFYQCLDKVQLKHVTVVGYKKDPKKDWVRLMHEIKLVQNFKHPNILKYFHPATYRLSSLHLVFEPFVCFLKDIIRYDVKKLYHPTVVKNVMWQLLSGLAYLHERAVMHRNIQPNNLALDSDGCLKICNFRNACYLWEKEVTLETDNLHYQSAELLMETSLCSSAVDIWSAACIFVELILEKQFFKGKTVSNVLGEIFTIFGYPTKDSWPEFFEIPESTYFYGDKSNLHHYNCLALYLKREKKAQDEIIMDLLHPMFAHDPKYRLRASSCLDHPFFKKEPLAINFQKDLSNCVNIALARRDDTNAKGKKKRDESKEYRR